MKINPLSCLSIIAVCCLLHFTPVFVYFRDHRWKKHAFTNQSKSSLGNGFKYTSSSQQVKRMLSHDSILVRFSWFGPEQILWCEKEPKQCILFCLWSGSKQVNYRTFLVWIHPKMPTAVGRDFATHSYDAWTCCLCRYSSEGFETQHMCVHLWFFSSSNQDIAEKEWVLYSRDKSEKHMTLSLELHTEWCNLKNHLTIYI